MSRKDLEKARAEAALARERLLGSVHAVQSRLSPSTIANDVWDGVRDRGETAVLKASEFASERPVAASAAAAGVVAFALRKPLFRLFRRRRPAASDPLSADQLDRRKGA